MSNNEYTYQIPSGYYYVGIRNDSSNSNAKLKAILTVRRADDIPITQFISPEILSGLFNYQSI